jgi:esterase/lipase superfamily enzyme
MPKGRYAVYEFKKASEGKEAKEKALEDIPAGQPTLFLIHGFNNEFEDVTKAYLDFEKRIRQAGFQGDVIGFTWPSYGQWYQYFGDKEQVEFAAPALVKFLQKFLPRLGQNALHVNTHSMGAYLLLRVLASYPGSGVIIDEVTCFAADVSNDVLEQGEIGFRAARKIKRLTSYFNRHDPVLGASAFANADGRLGLNGADEPDLLPGNAFQADCSTLIEGHSDYRKNDEVMEDLVAVLEGNASDQIGGRTETGENNTFRIGPEPEQDDSEAVKKLLAKQSLI